MNDGPIAEFPTTMVLLSVVNATDSRRAATDNLLRHLATGSHELMPYDINRYAHKSPLIVRETALRIET